MIIYLFRFLFLSIRFQVEDLLWLLKSFNHTSHTIIHVLWAPIYLYNKGYRRNEFYFKFWIKRKIHTFFIDEFSVYVYTILSSRFMFGSSRSRVVSHSKLNVVGALGYSLFKICFTFLNNRKTLIKRKKKKTDKFTENVVMIKLILKFFTT